MQCVYIAPSYDWMSSLVPVVSSSSVETSGVAMVTALLTWTNMTTPCEPPIHSQYTTVHHSIPQYTTVHHSIPQYTTVYHSTLFISISYLETFLSLSSEVPREDGEAIAVDGPRVKRAKLDKDMETVTVKKVN